MRISDWSSDVCSSDLAETLSAGVPNPLLRRVARTPHPRRRRGNRGGGISGRVPSVGGAEARHPFLAGRARHLHERRDRKTVEEGTSGAVRGDSGGRERLHKKKQQKIDSRNKRP